MGVTVWAWRHLALIRRLAHLRVNVLFLTDNLKEINDTDDLSATPQGEKKAHMPTKIAKSLALITHLVCKCIPPTPALAFTTPVVITPARGKRIKINHR